VKYVLNIDEATGHGTVTFQIVESPKIKITRLNSSARRGVSAEGIAQAIKTRGTGCFRGSPAAAFSSRTI
jgi:xanthine/uracil permease